MTPNQSSPRILEELKNGPLGAQVAPYVASLRRQQYADCTIVNHQLVLERFSRWLRRSKRDVQRIDEATILQFMKRQRGLPRNARAALIGILQQLRAAGVTAPAKPIKRSDAQCLVEEYRQHLLTQRGLTSRTVNSYVPVIGCFLQRLFGKGPVNVRAVQPADLEAEMKLCLRLHSRGFARVVITALRSFLRYLLYNGSVETDLTAAVPKVAYWEKCGLPRYLAATEVHRMLDHCERATALGKRNYAMLLLLAQLGLRASELLAVRLDDIDWLSGKLRVRSVKDGPQVYVPLPQKAGAALASYLRHGRPACECREVFVRGKAPYVGLACAGDVSNLVRQALDRAGVKSPCRGAHVLRHSLATEMMRQGASLDEIGEILRHRTVASTRVYAKVDVAALRLLALPWPGGAR